MLKTIAKTSKKVKVPAKNSPLQSQENLVMSQNNHKPNTITATNEKKVSSDKKTIPTEQSSTTDNAVIPRAAENKKFYEAKKPSYLDNVRDPHSTMAPKNKNEDFNNPKEHKESLRLEDPLDNTILPPSPVKPENMTQQQYIEYCILATIKECKSLGIPPEDYIPIAHLMRGHAGNNINMISSISSDVSFLRNSVDFTQHLRKEYLESLPKRYTGTLQQLSLKKRSMLPYELKAADNVNQSFSENRIIPTQESDYSNNPWYYNNTPNKHPDFAVVLEKPVGDVKLVALDAKVTKPQTYKYQDIIRVGTDDLQESTAIAQENLKNTLEAISQTTRTLQEDIALDDFRKALHDNIQSQGTQDTYTWVSNFNQLHETHQEIIQRYHIGMNLQTQISIDDMHVDAQAKQFFAQQFKSFYNSPNSSLQTFINNNIYSNNRSVAQHHEDLIKFANFLDAET